MRCGEKVVRCDDGTTPLIDNAVLAQSLTHADKGVIMASEQILMDLK